MQTNLFRKNSGETDQENLLDIQCYEWKFKDWSDQLEMTIRLRLGANSSFQMVE